MGCVIIQAKKRELGRKNIFFLKLELISPNINQ